VDDDVRCEEITRFGEEAPFVRYVEEGLSPFLEGMKATAELAEMLRHE
jgi:hypothetical protein